MLAVIALVFGLGVVGLANPPLAAGIITLQDSYQEFLGEPDRKDLDRALRAVISKNLEYGRYAEAERRRQLLPADRHDLQAGCFLIVARHAIAAGQVPSMDSAARNAKAVPLLRVGLTNPPYDPELSAQLAWALAESSPNLKAARQWLKHAQASAPESPYLADTAAWIADREGTYREAFKAIQRSLGLVTQIPEVAYHAGAIHAELGNTAEAVRYLRLALRDHKSFSGDRQAQELLAKLDRPRGHVQTPAGEEHVERWAPNGQPPGASTTITRTRHRRRTGSRHLHKFGSPT